MNIKIVLVLSLFSCTYNFLQAMQQEPATEANAADRSFMNLILDTIRTGNIKNIQDTLNQGLRQGFNINTVNRVTNQTLLDYAADLGNQELLHILIAAGADPRFQNRLGIAPLHYAHTPAVIQELINAGADVNVQDKRGNTPLMGLVKRSPYLAESIPALQTLLAVPALDITLKDNEGKTALDSAKTQQYRRQPEDKQKIINLLKSHMTLKERSLDYIRQHKGKFEKQVKKLPAELQEQL